MHDKYVKFKMALCIEWYILDVFMVNMKNKEMLSVKVFLF